MTKLPTREQVKEAIGECERLIYAAINPDDLPRSKDELKFYEAMMTAQAILQAYANGEIGVLASEKDKIIVDLKRTIDEMTEEIVKLKHKPFTQEDMNEVYEKGRRVEMENAKHKPVELGVEVLRPIVKESLKKAYISGYQDRLEHSYAPDLEAEKEIIKLALAISERIRGNNKQGGIK